MAESTPDITLRRRRTRRNIAFPIAALALALGLAVAGSLLTGEGGGWLTGNVETASSSAGRRLNTLSMILPMGYAFGAGMVSAVNPCGFPMLAPYLGLYLNDRKGAAARGRTMQLAHALLVGGAVTAGFVMLFAVAGLIIAGSSRALVDAFPWIGLTVGIALVAGGAWMLGGRPIYGALGEQLAARMGDPRKAGLRGYVLFGLSYGTASLSCTLPIFLTVVSTSLTLTDLPGAATQFVLYGLGMGSVITALTLSMAVMKAAMVTGLRRILPYMESLSAGLLLLAGAYLVYYWLTVGDLLDQLS